jgi:hypothetical protein
MSTSIKWEPVESNPRCLIYDESDGLFIQNLRNAFGDAPNYVLTDKHLDILRGMAAVNPDFQLLVHLVEEWEAVRVWGET